MKMLTHKAFPIGLLGAVHLRNRIQQIRPIRVNEEMNIHCEIGAWRITEKGLEFDFSTQVIIKSQLVWSEISTYFKKGRYQQVKETNTQENPHNPATFELDTLNDAKVSSQWYLPKNRGKAYAKISGDYNPIHISKNLAKLFGLKRDIAHGFGVLAQALACDNIEAISQHQGEISLDCIFKGPLFLEEEVYIKHLSQKQEHINSGLGFDIYCANNPKPSICALIKQH